MQMLECSAVRCCAVQCSAGVHVVDKRERERESSRGRRSVLAEKKKIFLTMQPKKLDLLFFIATGRVLSLSPYCCYRLVRRVKSGVLFFLHFPIGSFYDVVPRAFFPSLLLILLRTLTVSGWHRPACFFPPPLSLARAARCIRRMRTPPDVFC